MKTIVKKKRRIFATIMSVIMLTMMMAVPAFASEYESSGNFYVSMTSYAREFDGNNITIETWSTSSNTNYLITEFKVTLQRKVWYGWTDVGSAQLPKEGYGSATWTNVGPGTYRFFYTRANDGGLQKITRAHIYNS